MKKNISLIVILTVIVVIISIVQFSQPKQAKIEFDDENVGISIGNKAPDFELQELMGDNIKLSDHYGNAVILNFWASWCPPCREEMPEFQKIHDRENIVVLGVNLQEDRENIQSFKDKLGLTFPLLLDPHAKVKNTFNVFTQPVTYFIDKNGVIIDKKFGPLTSEEIEEKISKI
jgi:peroxiredoxin